MLKYLSRKNVISRKLNYKLYTPGPINTSATVKEACLFDYGSRDDTFLQMIKSCKEQTL